MTWLVDAFWVLVLIGGLGSSVYLVWAFWAIHFRRKP